MALIKSHDTASLVKDAVVLDLSDPQYQAESLRGRAVADANQAITEAGPHPEQVVYEPEADARRLGYEKGLAEGHAEALRRAAESLETLQEAWIAAAQRWDADRSRMLLKASHSLVELAVAIAEKIARRVPRIDPSIVVDQVAAAIQHVARPCDATVRVHPTDRALVEQALPRLAEQLAASDHVSLVADEAVEPGGCVVTSGRGRVDATIRKQAERIVEMLLPAGVEQGVGPA